MNPHVPSRINIPALKKECHDPFFCEHEQTEIRRKLDRNGRPRYYHQCLECGRSVGTQLKAAAIENPKAVKDFSVELESIRRAEFRAAFGQRQKEEYDRIEQSWRNIYDEYMNSPEWAEKRNLVFMRAGGICEGCRKKKATDCHHTTYENLKQEFLFELLALCRECHDRYHAHIFPTYLNDLKVKIMLNSGRNQDEPVGVDNA